MKTEKVLRYIVAPILLMIIVLMILLALNAYGISPEIESAEAATVLKRGSSGSSVRTLQTKLKNWGYYSGSIDGVFGSRTETAVRYFQRVNKLTVDGKVGPKTAKALGMSLSSSNSSSSNGSYSSQDLYLLARVVYGEARGEPYLGQVAVAAVVLNRVKSSEFPNTISGVVYQPWAFTAVNDGQINLTPNETAKKAAQDALNGWDPTYGCLFYYNPRTATSNWIRQKEIHLSIGSHVFCL
ncbi:MAG: spore cortex-lytic enzyme [Clostridia bacterium]|nr:spore cortex-lytic enzyme [Clostridia bacterium]